MNQSELEGESTKEAVYSAHFILLFHFIVLLCKNTVFIKIFPYQGRIYSSYVVSCNDRGPQIKKNNTESPIVRDGPGC